MTLTDFITLMQACPIVAISLIVIILVIRNWSVITAYIQVKLANTKYEYVINVAKGIWNRVDEDFRLELQEIIEKYSKKSDYFDELLLKRFPSLTQEDIDEIRQAIAGEINRNK